MTLHHLGHLTIVDHVCTEQAVEWDIEDVGSSVLHLWSRVLHLWSRVLHLHQLHPQHLHVRVQLRRNQGLRRAPAGRYVRRNHHL